MHYTPGDNNTSKTIQAYQCKSSYQSNPITKYANKKKNMPQNQRTKTKYNTIFRWRRLSIVTIIHNTCNTRNICNSSTIWYRHHLHHRHLWLRLRRYIATLLPVVVLDHRRKVAVIIRSTVAAATTTTTTTVAAVVAAWIVIKRIRICFCFIYVYRFVVHTIPLMSNRFNFVFVIIL